LTTNCNSYEILSDPQKRSVYDQYGEEGLSGDGGMGGGMSAEDLFSQFFGGMGGGMGGMFGGGGMQQQGPKRVSAFPYFPIDFGIYISRNRQD
jgi:DnaJ family protein A protein 2